VATANTATLDRDATTGGACVAGDGKIGGATKSLNSQTTTALLTSVALRPGQTIYVKNEAWNEAVANAGGNAGTAALPITVEGYNATRGDAPTGANRPRNNKAGVGVPATPKANFYRWKHLWFSNSAGIGVDTQSAGTHNQFLNVRSSHNATIGFSLWQNNLCEQCEADTNTTVGIDMTNQATVVASYVHGNTTIGIRITTGPATILQTIIAANGSHGIAVTGTVGLVAVNNTIDANTGATTDGLNLATAQTFTGMTLFLNNIFSNNGRDGVRVTDANSNGIPWSDYNNYSGNGGTARTNFAAGAHDLALAPAYVSSGAGNYAVGAAMRNVGYPGTFPASTSLGSMDMGAVPSGQGGPATGFPRSRVFGGQ
jgi:hypothetical protein